MDRLTPQDLSMLWPDDRGWPQDIGCLAVLEPGPIHDHDGALRIDVVRRAVTARLHLIPRLRQRLYRPRRGFGWPLWVDAEGFDIAQHVTVEEVPAPGDEATLLSVVERLRRQPFDRSRPLWRMWLLPGLATGQVGLYIRMHHAIADGVSGMAALGALLDAVAASPAVHARPFVPVPVPTACALLVDNVRRRAGELGRAVSTLLRPARSLRRLRAGWPAVRETLADPRAPRTSFNRVLGPGRRFALLGTTLEDIKRVARAYDATVNDVLLTVLAGGLRELLLARGEPVDVVLSAYVPVSLHRAGSGQARGNADGMMAVSLPVGVADPIAQLRHIAAQTAQRKKRSRPAGGTLLRNRIVQRAFLRVMARQRWANVYVANVPGPPAPLYLAGARLSALFPVVPLTGNITIGVGAISYAGQFTITVVVDRDACPDIDVLTTGMRQALRSLEVVDRMAV